MELQSVNLDKFLAYYNTLFESLWVSSNPLNVVRSSRGAVLLYSCVLWAYTNNMS